MRRKMSLIHSRLWLATIMLVISCVFSSAIPAGKATPQIYARLEETLPSYHSGDPYSDNTDYWQPVNLVIHFYSDAACTTPIALPATVDFELSYTGYYNTIYGNQNLSGLFSTGRAYKGNTTGEYFDPATWESMLVNNGVVEEKTRQDFELTSITGGIIIQPAITASHLPMF